MMSRPAILFLVIITPILAVLLAWLGIVTIRTNPLGWFLLLTGSIYTAGIILLVVIRRRHFWEAGAGGNTVQEEHGDYSFWWIALAMMAVFYLSPLEYAYLPAWIPHTPWMKVCGVGLVVTGGALFVWARRTLGANYSGHVSVKQRQELITTGPYRLIRHPAYAGYLLVALGISMGYSSLIGLVSILVLLLPSMIYRINIEEKVLTEHFGEAYLRYKDMVKRLIPGVW